jgi:rhodanese-related sulfurtransferase
MSLADPNAYAGDVPAQEALRMLAADSKAVMVDVRTEPEWQYVGAPDLSELQKDILFLSWQVYPSMQILPDFAQRLNEALRKRGAAESTPVLFLCRSGVRSKAAAIAMTQAGWTRCYNIADGFEGPTDEKRQRGRLRGWKADGLPWRQG